MLNRLQTYVRIGTASVENGSTMVWGNGTPWLAMVRPGFLFGSHVGRPIRIASVESNTALTLAYPWPGETQADGLYEIALTPAAAEMTGTTRSLLEVLSKGGFFQYDVAGALGERSTYDNRPKGFSFLQIDEEQARLWIKASDEIGNFWAGPYAYVVGPQGPPPAISINDTETLEADEPADVINTGTATAPVLKFSIPRGFTGHRGWAPVIAAVPHGASRDVLRVAGWTGGEGTAPTAHIGEYIGPAGLVSDIAAALNVKGATGPTGPVGVIWQGSWDEEATYQPGDLVSDPDALDQLAIWIALAETTGDRPRESAAEWAPFPGTFSVPLDYGLIIETATETRDYGMLS